MENLLIAHSFHGKCFVCGRRKTKNDKNKLQEIEAIEKYYERNFLFELRTNTQQKKKEIQQKLMKKLINQNVCVYYQIQKTVYIK